MELQEGFVAEERRKERRTPSDEEMEPVEFSYKGRDYEFGDRCLYSFDPGDDEDPVSVPFADAVWPLEVYHHVDDDEHGVRFAYRSSIGDLRYGLLPSSAFTGGSPARQHASRLAAEGVQIVVDKGKDFCHGLGAWREATDPDVAYVTSRPGWKEKNGRRVYVHGVDVIGEGRWYADDQSATVAKRSERQGSAIRWAQKISELATTPGLRACLGVALAGPLIELAHPQNFVFHFHGGSSTGKSTGAELACSVYGAPGGQYWQTWDTTVNAIEGNCEMADGACLVLDESTKWDSGAKQMSKAIYNVASQTGRARMDRSGELQRQKKWHLTGLSTGEVSIADQVGKWRKGGHDVRIHDVAVRPGDMTESAEHAEQCKDAVGAKGLGGHYGAPGRAWAEYLVESVQPSQVEALRNDIVGELDGLDDGAPETGRILLNCALVGAALVLGRRARLGDRYRLIGWSADESVEVAEWLAGQVLGNRRDSTPNERALRLFWEKVDTSPSRYPTVEQIREGKVHGDVWGIAGTRRKGTGKFSSATRDNFVYVSETHLKASGIPEQAGVGPREFLQAICDLGYASKVGRERKAGMRRTWYKVEKRPGEDVDNSRK